MHLTFYSVGFLSIGSIHLYFCLFTHLDSCSPSDFSPISFCTIFFPPLSSLTPFLSISLLLFFHSSFLYSAIPLIFWGHCEPCLFFPGLDLLCVLGTMVADSPAAKCKFQIAKYNQLHNKQ